MPTGLTVDQRRYWRRLARELGGRLTAEDTDILTGLVQALTLRDQAYATLERDGLTIIDGRGQIRKHPSFQIWRNCEAAARQALAKLGASPFDRRNLPEIGPAAGPSEFELFLDRKTGAD